MHSNSRLGHVEGTANYFANVMPMDKHYLIKIGFAGLLNGPLKQSVLRHAISNYVQLNERSSILVNSNADINSFMQK